MIFWDYIIILMRLDLLLFFESKERLSDNDYSLLKAGSTTSSGVDSVGSRPCSGLSVVTSLIAFNSFSMNDSSRTFLSSLVNSSPLSRTSPELIVSISDSVVTSLIGLLKLVVVSTVVAGVVVVVGQSGMSGHSLVSDCSPSHSLAPGPTGSWTTNLVRVWTPPGPQDFEHLVHGLSSDQRQSTSG